MKTKYLAILLIVFVICVGIFIYQFYNSVDTFISINETEVSENGSFSGMLIDAYGFGVANETITFHKPGNNTTITVTTNNDGMFNISNVEYVNGSDNSYKDFSFAGDGKYHACTFEGSVTVIQK